MIRRGEVRKWDGQAVLPPQAMLERGTKAKEQAMAEALTNGIAFVGIDIGKNSFHIVGLDRSGAIVLRQNDGAARWKHGARICRRF